MPKNVNSAYRVYSILEVAARQNINVSALEAWASTFSVPGTSSPRRNVFIAQLLGLLHDQIEDAHRKMVTSPYSPSLYQSAFSSIGQVIKIEGLSQYWRDFAPYLNSTTMQALVFCSEVLPNEEALIDEQGLAYLAKELQDLKIRLGKSDLPDDVKAFILLQVQIIENALLEYIISGRKVFTEALVRAAAEAAEDPDLATRSTSTDEFATLKKVWNFIKETNANVDPVLKILTAGTALATFAGNLSVPH